MLEKFCEYASLFLRLALGIGFLSAVGDRFGFWGESAGPGVAWGNFENFTAYTEKLNWFAPKALIPALAWLATVFEIVLGTMLILGFQTRLAAFVSGLMLLTFALAMTGALGIKAPLDYSVFTASAAAFLLSATGTGALSMEALFINRGLDDVRH
jgi:uncharacterized membrane protein YphA (DoxX/SURF4 family)